MSDLINDFALPPMPQETGWLCCQDSRRGYPMSSNRTVNKTYGTVSAERKGEMTGLEFVQGLVDGALPLNTMAKTWAMTSLRPRMGVSSSRALRLIITSIRLALFTAASQRHCSTAAWVLPSTRPSKKASVRLPSSLRFPSCVQLHRKPGRSGLKVLF